MPSSNLPSSFASAAAGQNSSRDSRGGRVDGRGAAGGDWSRRDGRPTNGTLTFRRSSTTPLGQPPSQPPSSTDHAVQPHAGVETAIAQPATYDAGSTRYTKDDILDIFHPVRSNDTSRLFISGWNPGHVNGNAARAWGKPNNDHVPQEPGACWNSAGDSTPMGLQEMSPEEREAFSTEINSPLKPPTQNNNKEGHQPGTNGRKASLSQGTGNPYGVSSPSSATRPGTRRRETIESNPFSNSAMASPTANTRFSRDDPSYWFPRKNAELKEAEPDDSDTEQTGRDAPVKSPFGNLVRANTTGTSGMGGIWPPANQSTPGGSAGGFGNFAMPSSSAVGDKRAGAAPGASRLAHLIPKDSSENIGAKAAESPNPMSQQSWRSRPRTDTDPFGDDGLSGSASLGGAQDSGSTGISQHGNRGSLGTPVKGSTSDFGMSGLNMGDDDGPVSPSETNPYRSPQAERHAQDENDPSGGERAQGGNFHEAPSNFGSISRGFGGVPFDGSDRSQTSSVGAKGYPAMNTLAGWPAPPAVGTPDRERTNFGGAFGNSLFSPIGELQSPGLSNLNTVFSPNNAGGIGTGSISRGSKLGSLFPPAMQAQMQSNEQENNLSDSMPDLRQSNPLGAIGRGNFSMPTRDTDSPIRSNRGMFEELFPSSDPNRAHGVFSTGDPGHQGIGSAAPQSFTPVGGSLPFGAGQPGAKPPVSHVRQMVMPDRMRWVYLDPQAQIQGPFTGLEMNDWYKANFFTPDLRVKKVEDNDFEPLGQLIRRIGNSREPFLVPQIGIPHGPPAQSGPFSPTSASGVVPPLSGVFPSFGRTLTAEEQNNLERRKQEEQYLMVQQRDFVMRQQALSKFQIPGGPGLQHHSSTHSLQSQPSFGNMTSPNPIGMPSQQQQQPIGAMPPAGFYEGLAGNGQGISGNGEPYRDDDMMNLGNLTSAERQVLLSMQGGSLGGIQEQFGAPALGSLRTGLPGTEELEEDSEGFRERLRQFEDLRAQHEAELAAKAEELTESEASDEPAPIPAAELSEPTAETTILSGKAARAARKKAAEEAALSLTQQVQQAQAAAAVSHATEPGMPMPFPPPASSGTPLPAPTAQRVRSNLPEQYSRSQSGTPDTNASVSAQPPPMAPWAKDPGAEGHKGPSLKEIQEAEARKAAKAEEAAAAVRKAVLEQETAALREREKVIAAAAGLPATSTWGHGSPAAAVTPWAKPGPSKIAAAGSPSVATASSKKTLADIQREEEQRKLRAAKEVTSQTIAPAAVSKSYANLAGKPNQLPLSGTSALAGAAAAAAVGAPPGSGWATVGAGGKVRIPTGPAMTPPARAVSAAVSKSTSASPVKPFVKPVAVTSVNSKASSGTTATDEFNRWVHRELSRGITGVNDIASFQAALDVLPLDTGIIADAVYANSTTMDGRHFAEEFVRRKSLAERGIIEKQTSADSKAAGSSSGWSEVAKKGSSASAQPKDADAGMPAGFKVVPGRKSKSKK
ncbi:hypothetical protein G7046_g6685 [Stylonectria norvegica]|nr:hypothetical protein G7046_g6685 [Stylonectria norvegica]